MRIEMVKERGSWTPSRQLGKGGREASRAGNETAKQ